ncbi:MAG: NupC/NupG family nucleoside CNT transporter, partial [Bacteroidota bacterium]
MRNILFIILLSVLSISHAAARSQAGARQSDAQALTQVAAGAVSNSTGVLQAGGFASDGRLTAEGDIPGVAQDSPDVLQDSLAAGQADSSRIISLPAASDSQGILQSGNVIDPVMSGGFSLMTLLRGMLGMVVLIIIAWLFSTNRRAVVWRTVIIGLAIQLVLAVSILYVPFVRISFEFVGKIFVKILDFTKEGSTFLFGSLMDVDKLGSIFAFQILPTIIFFSALTSLLFYLGIIQKIVYGLAWLMTKTMKLSGAESLSVAGNIFLGQTESPLMVKAYLPRMNKSEIMLVMTGGMATLAGGVLAAYIGFLGGGDPVQRLIFAKHLLAASVMAAPGAVVISKILVPQTEEIIKDIEITKDKAGNNVL